MRCCLCAAFGEPGRHQPSERRDKRRHHRKQQPGEEPVCAARVRCGAVVVEGGAEVEAVVMPDNGDGT